MSKTIHAFPAVACALLLNAATVAHGGQGPQGPTAGPRDARDYMVIGCVTAEAARAGDGAPGQTAGQRRFQITDSRSKSDTYRLDGDADQLAFHVGHYVEVRGSISMAATANRGAGSGDRAPLPTLKVKSLVYLSQTCPK